MDASTKSTTPGPEFNSTYNVKGMTCGHCVSSVTEEISELDAVTGVDVALDAAGTSVVTVRSTAMLDDEKVRAAIDEAGYELVTP